MRLGSHATTLENVRARNMLPLYTTLYEAAHEIERRKREDARGKRS